MLVLATGLFLFGRLGDPGPAPSSKRVVVLGVDGMDYEMTREMIQAGRLPSFAALAREGAFLRMETCMPPLSPVAWTCVTTGRNPGGHGIFDFLCRDPTRMGESLMPEDGTSRMVAEPADREWPIPFTSYVWPSRRQRVLRRQGTTFWDVLESRGVPATVCRMPANFPVSDSKARVLAGMGTPDLEGTYGTFTYVTDSIADWTRQPTGGRVLRAEVEDGRVAILDGRGGRISPWLVGPVNPLLSRRLADELRSVRVSFDVYLDRRQKSAALCLQGRDIVLRQGEWSPWANVTFVVLPGVKSVRGLVRFYLQETTPYFRLFVTPVNLAPGTEGLATRGFDRYLSEALGLYSTLGMPEETKALTEGLFDTDEYLVQSRLCLEEQLKALRFLLADVKSGCLFFYFSTLDLDQHVLWRHQDPTHPAYEKDVSLRHAGAIRDLYVKMDDMIGEVRSRLTPQDVLYVVSDHGFAAFRREFNLVRWLQGQGILVYRTPAEMRVSNYYAGVDWSATRAYGVGFNSLYLNLKGREALGAVEPRDYDSQVEDLRAKLAALRDADGTPVFSHLYRPHEIYPGFDSRRGPDLLLGYNVGYGPSDASVLGAWSEGVLVDHTTGFSGQHVMDSRLVPGVCFSSRRLTARRVRLEDVPVTVIKEFGCTPAAGMTGESLY